jgi:hypothetical protein
MGGVGSGLINDEKALTHRGEASGIIGVILRSEPREYL